MAGLVDQPVLNFKKHFFYLRLLQSGAEVVSMVVLGLLGPFLFGHNFDETLFDVLGESVVARVIGSTSEDPMVLSGNEKHFRHKEIAY